MSLGRLSLHRGTTWYDPPSDVLRESGTATNAASVAVRLQRRFMAYDQIFLDYQPQTRVSHSFFTAAGRSWSFADTDSVPQLT